MPKLTLTRCAQAIPPLVLALLFGWAAWERFRLPQTPCADPDVWVYLIPGLGKLLWGTFGHVYGQCFLYPWFLYAILRAGADFRWITLIQHGLGLGTGALLFGAWMQWRSFASAPRVPALAFKLLGVLLAGAYLLSTTSIEFEHALRPESIFPFFAVLNLHCVLHFVRARFFGGSARRAILSGGAAIFFSVVAWLLKPSFAAVLIPANLPVLISLGRAGACARDKWLLAGVPAVAVAGLLIWPEWQLRRSDQMGALFLARSLFSIHANFIADVWSEDLARHAATPYPPEFLSAAHDTLRESLRESRQEAGRQWPVLGFNPDYLVYGSPGKRSFAGWLSGQLKDQNKEAEFYRYAYWHAWRRHPEWMVSKAIRQLGFFYQFGDCPAYLAYPQYDLSAEYRLSAECLAAEPKLLHYPPGAALRARTGALTTTTEQIGPYPLTDWIFRGLAAGYLPGCLGAVLLALGVWTFPLLRRAFGSSASVLLFLYSYNFGTVLTLAISHSLDVGRYSRYQLSYALLAEFGSIWLGLETLIVLIFGLENRDAVKYRGIWQLLREPWKSPGRFLEGTRGLADVPGGNGDDALLLMEMATGHSAVASQDLTGTPGSVPADLIIATEGTRRRGALGLAVTIILRYAFGWSPSDPLSGVWRCSRRFCRDQPPGSTRQEGIASQLEVTMRALDQGFSIREVSLSNEERHGQGPPHIIGQKLHLLRALLSGCFRYRPWISLLGVVGMTLLLLSVSFGNSAWRHRHRRNHHVKPVALILSITLLCAGLLSIQAGLTLGHAALRRRIRPPALPSSSR